LILKVYFSCSLQIEDVFYSIWAKEYIDCRCVINYRSLTARPSRDMGYKKLRAAHISSSVNYVFNRYAVYSLWWNMSMNKPVHIPSNISYHFILSKVCRFPNSRFWSFQTRPIASLSIIGPWFIDYESSRWLIIYDSLFIWSYLGTCGADIGDLDSVWIWGKTNFELISSLFNWQPAPFIVNKVSSVKSRVRLRSRNLPGDRIRPILYPLGICFSGAFTCVLLFKCQFYC